ncbi:hypothetical protein BC793_101669 [Actinoplanes xinjiangensis]|uniref:Uncharacterized protein n=2 Tax=Actinoplanes xinjiangensis TaxID=512350 RepID=A0A316FYN8_9ACTN|nr:hypothetical protein BC793_101669 [Actinoplanes xinjiangensis]GIF36643.1 hypothetical protein Axi01nite_09540 [Actinoplanes xinjiangensis]
MGDESGDRSGVILALEVEVRDVLTRAGFVVHGLEDERDAGVRVYSDVMPDAGAGVHVQWMVSDQLRTAAQAAFGRGDSTDGSRGLHRTANEVMSKALLEIVVSAGFAAVLANDPVPYVVQVYLPHENGSASG